MSGVHRAAADQAGGLIVHGGKHQRPGIGGRQHLCVSDSLIGLWLVHLDDARQTVPRLFGGASRS